MSSTNSDAIAFLVPGLVHQFGNLLLTIQGHALNLDGANAAVARARQAIQSASERGGVTLRMLRILLGEPGQQPADAAALLELFGELARIPVREAGHRLEVQAEAVIGRQVVANEFLPALTEAVRGLLAAAPPGTSGRLCIDLTAAPDRVLAAVRFQPERGNLPFPMPLADLAVSLAARARGRGDRTGVAAIAHGLQLHFGGLPAAGEPCSDLHGSLLEPS